MNSNLILYQTRILNERNMVVEGLENYLQSCVSLSVSAFSMLRLAPTMDVKVAVDQSELYKPQLTYNYCVIQNASDTTKKIPYFINAIEWLAADTLRLSLTLDILNFEASDLSDLLSDRTIIAREHVNRFELKNGRYIPLVDRVSEGMNYPLRKVAEFTARQSPDVSYYLAFLAEGTDEDKPLSIVLYPETSLKAKVIGYTGSSTTASSYTSYEVSDVIYFTKDENNPSVNPSVSVICNGEPVGTDHALGFRYYDDELSSMVYLLATSFRILRWVEGSGFGMNQIEYYYYEDGTFAKSVVIDKWNSGAGYLMDGGFTIYNGAVAHTSTSIYMPSSLRSILALPLYNEWSSQSSTTADYYLEVKNFSNLVRSDTRLQKIVSLPYAPFAFPYDSENEAITPTGFFYSNGLLIQKEENPDFRNPVTFTPTNFASFFISYPESEVFDTSADFSLANETKILQSEFTILKIVYDSFSYEWKLENYPYVPDLNAEMSFTFKASNAMTSQFMLMNIGWSTRLRGYPIAVEDYPQILAISANNELTVYTSSYLDYIRNGYNYDKKIQAMNATTDALGLLSSVNSSATGFLNERVNSITPVTLSAYSTNIAQSLYSVYAASETRAISMQRRLIDLQNQSVGASGITDFDLSTAYTNNRVKAVLYQTQDEYIDRVRNFFRLYGYARSRQGEPDYDSRYWFNFEQCTPDFGTEKGSLLPLEYKNLLSAKLQEGVTFFHEHEGEWDFDQQKENWETDFLE